MSIDQLNQAIYCSKPQLKYCKRFDESSGLWILDRHSHPYIELIFFIDGIASVDISGTQLSVNLYDVVVYPAGMEHQETILPNQHQEIICFWLDIPELQLESAIHTQDRSGQLQWLFDAIYREGTAPAPDQRLLEYYEKALLTQILRQLDHGQQRPSPLPHTMQYIHAHFTEPLSLAQLADMEHISKSYLSRQFKHLTGKTVIEYVNHLRTEMAKKLLITTDKSVTEIAYQVGYESPKYFYRTFRAATDESPAGFRRGRTAR